MQTPTFRLIENVSIYDPRILWSTRDEYFRTIGFREVPVAVMPSTYVRTDHPEWEEIRKAILATGRSGDFSQLDIIYLDLGDLDKIISPNTFGDADNSDLWEAYPEWSDYFCRFDEEWGDLMVAIEDLAFKTLPHVPPLSGRQIVEEWQKEQGIQGREPLPNRISPPTMREALQMMISKLDEGH